MIIENHHTEITHKTEHTNSTIPFLLFMPVISAFLCFCTGLFLGNSGFVMIIEYIIPILMVSYGVVWCYLDSYRYDIFLTRRFYLCLLFSFVIVFPYYAVKTRGVLGMITIDCAFIWATLYYGLTLIGAGLGCTIS